MRGVDYKSQVELVDELYEDTFDLDGDSKVRIYMWYTHIQQIFSQTTFIGTVYKLHVSADTGGIARVPSTLVL